MLKPSCLRLTAIVSLLLAAALPTARAADVNPASTLYVTNGNGVSTFDAATGALTNVNFLPGLTNPSGVVVAGNRLYVATSDGRVGEYDATTGAAVNASLVTGTDILFGLALSGNLLLVADSSKRAVSAYDAATGAVVNAAFITGLDGPESVLVAGGTIYVSNFNSGDVGAYSASTGQPLAGFTPAHFGLGPSGLARLGNTLFVSVPNNGHVGEVDAITGTILTKTFLTGLDRPEGLYLAGTTLLVNNNGSTGAGTTAGAYDALTGAVINPSYLSGLNGPNFITGQVVVPEPSTWASVAAGVGLLGLSLRRHRRARFF